MTEKRRAPRLRTFKGGSITFGLAPSIDCVVRNLSETGAQLAVQAAVRVPDEFTLLIKPEMTKRACRVVWRKADKIGVNSYETLPQARGFRCNSHSGADFFGPNIRRYRPLRFDSASTHRLRRPQPAMAAKLVIAPISIRQPAFCNRLFLSIFP